MPRSIMYGENKAQSAIGGTVTYYADLPTPITNYVGTMYYVTTGSGGFLSAIGAYKYPAGLYAPNQSATAWIQTPLKVHISEDSVTFVNISNWAEYYNFAFDIKAGDRVIYNNVAYENLTGIQTTTSPDVDTTNWSRTETALKTQYDNTTSGLVATNTQAAIDESFEIQKNINFGIVSMPSYVDNGDGSITITSSCVCNFSKSILPDGNFYRQTVTVTPTITLTDNAENYVYIDYNNGSPVYGVTLNASDFLAEARFCPTWRIGRFGTELHILDYDDYAIGYPNKALFKDLSLGFDRLNGLVLSTEPTRIPTVSAGQVWFGIKLQSLAENKAGVTGELYEYFKNASVWTENLVTEYDSLYYSDETDRRILTNNRYVAKYFYRGVENDNHTYYVHGNQYTNISDAISEQVPVIPPAISGHSIYVGKIVIQKDALDGVAYPRAWEGAISSSGVTSHEDLTNINQAGVGVLNGHISNIAQSIAGSKTFTDKILIGTTTELGGGDSKLVVAQDSIQPTARFYQLNADGASVDIGHLDDGTNAKRILGLLRGNGTNDPFTEFILTALTNGNIGINKAIPTEALDIVGNIITTGNNTTTGNISSAASIINSIWDGISALQVTGATSLNGSLDVSGAKAGDFIAAFTNASSIGKGVQIIAGQKIPTGAYDLIKAYDGTGTTVRFTLKDNGFVGVNKELPTEALDVVGNIAATGNISSNTIVATGNISGDNITATDTISGNIGLINSIWDTTSAFQVTGLSTFLGNVGITGNFTLTDIATLDSSLIYLGKNTRIGTTTEIGGATSKFVVEQDSVQPTARFYQRNVLGAGVDIGHLDDGTNNSRILGLLKGNSTTDPFSSFVMSVFTNGHVGINKAVPTVALDVVGNITATGDLNIDNITATTNVSATNITATANISSNAMIINSVWDTTSALQVTGTTSLAGALDVFGAKAGDFISTFTNNSSIGQGIKIVAGQSSPTGVYDIIQAYDGTGTTLQFEVKDNGNTGIATTPTKKLDVNGETLIRTFADLENGSVLFSHSTGNATQAMNDSAGTTKILLNTNGNTYFNGGNVGINKAIPTEVLDVVGNIASTGNLYSNANVINSTWDGVSALQVTGSSDFVGNVDITGTLDVTADVTFSKILTTNLSAVIAPEFIDFRKEFNLAATPSISNGIHLAGYNVRDAFNHFTIGEPLFFEHGAISSPTIMGALFTSGNWAIGNITTDTPGYKLRVDGACANTTGVWETVSDKALKENIKEVTNPLDKVLRIANTVKQYNYIEETGIEQNIRTQFIAQELIEEGFNGHVKETLPMNSDVGALLGWEYDEEGNVIKEGRKQLTVEQNLTPYLFPAIKELNNKVEEQQKTIDLLLQEITYLKERLLP